jgi:hypothetical protein
MLKNKPNDGSAFPAFIFVADMVMNTAYIIGKEFSHNLSHFFRKLVFVFQK